MATKRPPRSKAPPALAQPQTHVAGRTYAFRLYVAGASGRSALALQNLQALCHELLPGKHTIEVIDLLKHPELAAADEIIAIPTLVRVRPRPVRKILGDLSDRGRVLLGMDIAERAPG